MRNFIAHTTLWLFLLLLPGLVFAVEPIQQNTSSPSEFRVVGTSQEECKDYWWEDDDTCRTIPYPTDWFGENLLYNGDFSNGLENWSTEYSPSNVCTIQVDGGVLAITAITTRGCNVTQVYGFKDDGYTYRLVADVTAQTDKSETYTDPDGSDFNTKTGTVTRILTRGGNRLYLQTPGGVSRFTKWDNIVVRRIKK